MGQRRTGFRGGERFIISYGRVCQQRKGGVLVKGDWGVKKDEKNGRGFREVKGNPREQLAKIRTPGSHTRCFVIGLWTFILSSTGGGVHVRQIKKGIRRFLLELGKENEYLGGERTGKKRRMPIKHSRGSLDL